MSFIFTPAKTVGLPIYNTKELFPVRRVYCVGRNYAEHALEMGADPTREPPFFFMKPNDENSLVICSPGKKTNLSYPGLTDNYQFEGELVVLLKKGGRNLTLSQAQDAVFGYALGLDMTRRDLQAELKEKRHPWEASKAFDYGAPIGLVYPKKELPKVAEANIELLVNGKQKQLGNINQLIWKIPEIIAKLSELFELHAGDIIYTGTPKGVGKVVKGDEIELNLTGMLPLKVQIS